MKLRNRKSILIQGNEGTPKRSFGSRITQRLYIAFLAALVAYLAYIAVTRIYFIEERGLVEIERIRLGSEDGGRIISLAAAQKHHFRKGDILARIRQNDARCFPGKNSQITNLRFEIAKNRDKLTLSRRNLAQKKNKLSSEVLRRALEIDRALSERGGRLSREIERLETETRLLSSLLRQQQRRLKQLIDENKSLASCMDEIIRAPGSGAVLAVYKKRFEIVQRGEALMDFLPDDAATWVESYMNDDTMEYLHEGKEAIVTFPDGRGSNAIIDSVYSSATLRQEMEWDRYKPVKTKLVVRLRPASRHESELWKRHDRVNVKVRIRK